MDIDKKVEKYLTEMDGDAGAGDPGMASLSTGLRRVLYKLERANTPPKYVEAFDMISALITNFPLKAKIIWKAVADAQVSRFGSSTPVE